jgi:Rieske Fe-S protein
MIFRLPSGELRALSAVCTHGQCNVRYRPEKNDIHCACHEGLFTAEGINVPGTPPPEPLRKFNIQQLDDDTLMVSAEPLDSMTPTTETSG